MLAAAGLAGTARAGQRAELGDELIARIGREPRNASWLWAIGRFGARLPLYGPLNCVVAPAVAERWIQTLLQLKELSADAASAIAQIGARTDDPARDCVGIDRCGGCRAVDRSRVGVRGRETHRRGRHDHCRSGPLFGETLPKA